MDNDNKPLNKFNHLRAKMSVKAPVVDEREITSLDKIDPIKRQWYSLDELSMKFSLTRHYVGKLAKSFNYRKGAVRGKTCLHLTEKELNYFAKYLANNQ